jgi:hypothetical protein
MLPPITESVDDPDVCEAHGCFARLYDDGNMESGPGEPYEDCPECRKEHEPHCPQCGASEDEGFKVTSRWTPNYGGGYDTYEKCSRCNYTEVST